MGITIYDEEQFELVRKAGKLAAGALKIACDNAKPGISTGELDKMCEEWIKDQGAIPTFLGYMGFPASLCASVNQEVVHGIPSDKRILKEGDIASFDIGVTVTEEYKGSDFNYIGDNARTVAVGEINPRVQKLLDDTNTSLHKGIECCKAGNTIKDIATAVYNIASKEKYGVVRMFGGHGVGHEYHSEPFIPNWPEYFKYNKDTDIQAGMLLCIEPMFNLGSDDVRKLKDDWTIVTSDHKMSAHFEHTILVTKDGPEVVTVVD